MYNVWIASHCSTKEHLQYLIEAITSCTYLTKKHKLCISLSLGDGINPDPVRNYLDSLDLQEIKHGHRSVTGWELVVRESKMSQFEHLRLLVEEQQLEPDDWIMFLDDDDMLFSNALDYCTNEYNGHVGLQYIAIDKDTEEPIGDQLILRYDRLGEYMDRWKDRLLIEEDFSGTTITYRYLQWWFSRRYKYDICHMLKDVELMSFIEEELPSRHKLDIPIVWRRMKDSSPWIDSVRDIICDLMRQSLQQLASIQKTPNKGMSKEQIDDRIRHLDTQLELSKDPELVRRKKNLEYQKERLSLLSY